MLCTVPNVMSLNFSKDCPACSPSPLSNETVIVGPSFDRVVQASQAPMSTANSGISQTMETRDARRAAACPTVGGEVTSSMAIDHPAAQLERAS